MEMKSFSKFRGGVRAMSFRGGRDRRTLLRHDAAFATVKSASARVAEWQTLRT